MYLSDHSKNLISAEEKVAELIKQRDQLRSEVERLGRATTNGQVNWMQESDRQNARAERAEASLHALRLVCGTTDADKFTTWVDRANARAERADAELAAERARLDDLVADLNDACITLASAKDDCDDYALLNTGFKLEAVRDVLLQYIPNAAMKEGA